MVAKTEPDFVTLVPELADWNEGRGIDIDSWICCIGDYSHAIGYGRLFWPPFLEHDDAVFFAQGFAEENYRGFMDRTGGDRRAVEAVMNHHHLLRLFGDRSSSPSVAQLSHVAGLLSETWLAKLCRDFPARNFRVDTTGLDVADLDDAQITFRQV
ncbi:MAG: hypothetical protein JNK04_25525 [Myxococcales bacterium]|nr:hypothetical protein [Myxococcales bacterium]